MSSWVKVSRKLATSAIAAKPEYLAVWVHLLLAASYKEGEILVGRQIVRLNPGDLVFGRKKFSEKTGVSESILRGALKALESLQQITIKTESKFSIISITNWSQYQYGSPANDQQMTSRSPADDHNKEIQEVKEKDQKTCSTHSVERVDFDAFWKIYPRKVGKQAALKAWNKLKPDLILFAEIESAIERASRSPAWLKDSGQFIPHPSAWLNGKRWEDEPDPSSLMPCQEIADAYNEICGGVFRRCESMTPERMTLIASVGSREIAGRKRFIEGGVDYWRKFFTAAAKSKARAGNNPRGFVADFDYVLKNANNVFESFQ